MLQENPSIFSSSFLVLPCLYVCGFCFRTCFQFWRLFPEYTLPFFFNLLNLDVRFPPAFIFKSIPVVSITNSFNEIVSRGGSRIFLRWECITKKCVKLRLRPYVFAKNTNYFRKPQTVSGGRGSCVSTAPPPLLYPWCRCCIL